MSLENRITDLSEAIGLEIKEIRNTVDYHSDSEISPITALDGDEVVIVAGKLVTKPRPIIIESPDGQWKTSTNDIDNPITNAVAANTNVAISTDVNFRQPGLWKPYISFLYSADSTGSDFQAEARLNNVSIAKCQPNSGRIVKQEGKDAALQNPDNPNAGTAQILSYGMDFHAINIVSSGILPFVLLVVAMVLQRKPENA